jgi:hypothetical protein
LTVKAILMKELIAQQTMEFREKVITEKKNIFFECPAQESLSKFSVTKRMDENLWGEPSDSAMRQAAGTKKCKADNDEDDI